MHMDIGKSKELLLRFFAKRLFSRQWDYTYSLAMRDCKLNHLARTLDFYFIPKGIMHKLMVVKFNLNKASLKWSKLKLSRVDRSQFRCYIYTAFLLPYVNQCMKVWIKTTTSNIQTINYQQGLLKENPLIQQKEKIFLIRKETRKPIIRRKTVANQCYSYYNKEQTLQVKQIVFQSAQAVNQLKAFDQPQKSLQMPTGIQEEGRQLIA